MSIPNESMKILKAEVPYMAATLVDSLLSGCCLNLSKANMPNLLASVYHMRWKSLDTSL